MHETTMSFPMTRQGVRNLDQISGEVLPMSGGRVADRQAGVNVGDTEKFVSTAGGAALAVYGLSQGSITGFCLALAGGALLIRGLTGHCHLYQALGVNSAARVDPTQEYVYRQ